MQVLDPACGSGNFLYVALRLLLDLEKEVITLLRRPGRQLAFPAVSPAPAARHRDQPLRPRAGPGHGLDRLHPVAAATTASASLREPILKPLDNILQMDAILAYDAGQGRPGRAGVAGGGCDHRQSAVFGREQDSRANWAIKYVDDAVQAVRGTRPRVRRSGVLLVREGAGADRSTARRSAPDCWRRKAIRGGANRKVLERIKETGDIFWAQSDRDWILDGATVHVSMVGFDGMERNDTTIGRQTGLDASTPT